MLCNKKSKVEVMKIYEVGGAPDWVCANSAKEAKQLYQNFYLDKMRKEDIRDELKSYPPFEVSGKDMDTLLYVDNDSVGHVKKITFREELKRRTKPEMFAFSDY